MTRMELQRIIAKMPRDAQDIRVQHAYSKTDGAFDYVSFVSRTLQVDEIFVPAAGIFKNRTIRWIYRAPAGVEADAPEPKEQP